MFQGILSKVSRYAKEQTRKRDYTNMGSSDGSSSESRNRSPSMSKSIMSVVTREFYTLCLLVLAAMTVAFFYVSFFSEVITARNYKGNIIVGVIAAKESTYVEEWLAHHFYYGVDKIIVFDNNKPEDTHEKSEMKRICSLFGKKCEILDFNNYDGISCLFGSPYLCSSFFLDHEEIFPAEPTRRQGMARNVFYYHNNNYQKYKWMMMIDIDEFLVTANVDTSVNEYLNSIGDSVSSLIVNRWVFGTSNHTTRPKGDVRSNYCMVEELDGQNNKGAARSKDITWPSLTNHRFYTRSLYSTMGVKDAIYTKNARNTPLKTQKLALPSGAIAGDFSPEVGVLIANPRQLVINHYFSKSIEEFYERRSRPSLNYMMKLDGVWKTNQNDKISTQFYLNDVCPLQRLDKLPPLSTAEDYARAMEHSKNNKFSKFGSSSNNNLLSERDREKREENKKKEKREENGKEKHSDTDTDSDKDEEAEEGSKNYSNSKHNKKHRSTTTTTTTATNYSIHNFTHASIHNNRVHNSHSNSNLRGVGAP